MSHQHPYYDGSMPIVPYPTGGEALYYRSAGGLQLRGHSTLNIKVLSLVPSCRLIDTNL